MAAILPPPLAPSADVGSSESSRRNVAVAAPLAPAVDWRAQAASLASAAASARDRAAAAGLWAEAAAIHAANGSADAAALAQKSLAFVPGHPTASLVLSDALVRRGERDGARAVLTASWRANPLDDRVADALESACEDAHDWAALDAILVARLERAGASDRKALLVRLARIRASRGDHAGQVSALEQLASDEGALERDERARAWLGAAALRAGRLADPAGAFDCAARALGLAPADAETRRACEEFARSAGRERDLYGVLDRVAPELASSPDEERVVRLTAAAIAERHAALRDAAASHYERVLELAPSDAEALAGLTRVAQAAGRWSQVRDILRVRATLSDPGDRGALLEKLAELLSHRLHDAAGAADACRAALELATSGEQRVRLLRDLAAHCEAAGDLAGRLEALEALPDAERDPRAILAAIQALVRCAADPRERAELELRAAVIAERELGQSALALGALTRAVRACPELDGARHELARVANEIGCLAERARVLADVAVAAPVHVGAELWRELAQARDELGEGERAAEAWEQVRRREPEDAQALAALRRIYDAAGRHAELASVLAASRAAGDRSALTSGRLAELLALPLSLPREALPLAAEALRHEPACAPARRAAIALASRSDALGAKAFALAERALAQVPAADAAEAWIAIARGSGAIEAWRRAARIEAAAGRREVAKEAWLAVLEREAGDGEAALQLDVLLGDEDPAPLRARVAWFAVEAGGDHGAAALERAARMAAAAGDETLAVRAWRALLASAPDHAGAQAALLALARGGDGAGDRGVASSAAEGLEEALRRTGNARRLIALLELRLDRMDEGARAPVLEELADLHERLGETDAAATRWREAAQARPTARAWAALAGAERRRGAWSAAVDALGRVAACSEVPRERADAWREVANVMETRLGDREGALESWRRVLAEDPDDATALQELARLLGGAERWAELADVLGRQAAVVDRRANRVAEGAELRMRAARIRQDRLGDPAGAFRMYCGVLERIPAHRDAVDALHALACAGHLEAAEHVERLHERAGDVSRWAQVLEVRAAACEDPRARAALRLRTAALHESAGEHARALDAATQALQDDPDSSDALAAAERLAAERDDALVPVLAACARRAREPHARAALLRRIARRGADSRAAAEAWSEVLALHPGDVEALDGLVAAQRASANGAGLAEALRQRASAEHDAAARAKLLAELADVEERRGDLAAAAAALRAWLDLEPDDRAALANLERVLAADGKADELVPVLARQMALCDRTADVEGRAALRYRLAELRADHRGDREGAVALLEEILALDPTHDGALTRLEAMLEEDPADARVAAVLSRAYEQEHRWDALAAVIEVHAPELPSAEVRKAALLRLAALRERHLGNAELAFVALSRAFAEDPADPAVRAELTRVAFVTGQEEDLAGAFEEALERVAGPTAVELLVALGHLCADRLGDAQRAVEWWARAWRMDGQRAAAVIPRLERLCIDLARHAELSDLLEWRAGQDDGARRAELLDRAARIRLEQLGDRDRAAALWRQAIAADPRHLTSLRSLARLSEERGEAGGLIAWAEALVEAGLHQEAADAARRALALERLAAADLERLSSLCGAAGARPERARVAERRAAALETAGSTSAAAAAWREAAAEWESIGHVDAVVGALEKALALDGDAATFERVRALHAERGAWRDHVRVCAEHAERIAEPADRAVLLAEAARVQEQRLAEGELAFFSWCRVLSLDATNAEAAEATERLAAASATWDDLAAVWEQIADAAAGPSRAAALVALGRVRDRSGDAAGARSALAEALRADPCAEPALARLTESLAADGLWDEVLEALALARDAAEGPRAAALQRRIAEITESHLADPVAAVAAWREVRRRDPADLAALDALERLCGELGRWEELDAVLVERAQRTPAPRERATWLRRSAAIRDERLDDVPGAVRRAEEALALDPTDAATLARLARLYERAGRVADRARVLERQAAATSDARERLALLVSAGEAWTRLGDRAKAEAVWSEVLRLDPDSPDALAAVADLHEGAREWAAALDALRRLAASPRAAGRAADAWFRSGRIRVARGDIGAAEEAWRRALDVDPAHLGALRSLRESREAAGDRGAVARLLEAEARASTDPAERARALGRLGTLARERQDVEAARRWFAEAVAADATQLDAARPLAEIHVARGEWDRAAPLLESVVSGLPADVERREAARWWHRLGLAAEHLGDAARALACQRRARDLDGSSLPVLERLAALAEREDALEDALSANEAILAHHRDGLTRDERAGTHLRVAALEERLGRAARAIAALNEALTVDPARSEARERLVALLEARSDFRGALNHRRRLAEALAPAARVAALRQIAAICRDRLDDLPAAIEAAEAAVRLAPEDVALTDELVTMLLRAGQPRRAADALARLLSQPGMRADAARAARLALALGRLLRDRVRDNAGAARALESALELDPALTEALAELEALLAADRRWRDIERIYTAILERTPRTPATRAARIVLWRGLASLYTHALHDADAARTAAQVAASIEAGAPATVGE